MGRFVNMFRKKAPPEVHTTVAPRQQIIHRSYYGDTPEVIEGKKKHLQVGRNK
jgi:hypothetical protein